MAQVAACVAPIVPLDAALHPFEVMPSVSPRAHAENLVDGLPSNKRVKLAAPRFQRKSLCR